eukprot:997726-Rhodomonas_salina.3
MAPSSFVVYVNVNRQERFGGASRKRFAAGATITAACLALVALSVSSDRQPEATAERCYSHAHPSLLVMECMCVR